MATPEAIVHEVAAAGPDAILLDPPELRERVIAHLRGSHHEVRRTAHPPAPAGALPVHPSRVEVSSVASAFGVSDRQIIRDLEVLQFCGLPGGYIDDLFDVDIEAVRDEGASTSATRRC
nr:hypothetical protein [Tessaracoccus coleopterorum]